MAHRSLATFGVVAAALLMSNAPATVDGPAGRRPDGRPDLQGVWDFRTLTPMERPKELAGQEVLTDEEAAEFERVNRRNQDIRDATPRAPVNGTPTTADVERAYNDFWWDFGTKVVSTKRTSLIVDPPDGRIPPLTADAQRRAEMRAARRQRLAVGPEDRGVGERCILGFNSGPPMTPSAYNNNVQIFQTRDHVVLLNEMVHNARIIPVDGRPHLPAAIPQWVGDSRGRWAGDTLVVETKNFKGETAFPGSSAALHLVERFTRLDANTLVYEFTVEDPTTWTRAWTAQIPMTRADGVIYEYACHEGNYGLANLLSAARALERAGAGR